MIRFRNRSNDQSIEQNMNWSEWARHERGNLSQAQIYAKLGISHSCYWRMVYDNVEPSARNKKKIADSLGIEVWQLMRRVSDFTKKAAEDSAA